MRGGSNAAPFFSNGDLMKQLCLIFCGEDGDAAKSLAQSIRTDEVRAMIVSAYEFNGREWEPDRVIIMPDAPRWQAERIVACYPNAERQKKPKPEPVIIPFEITAFGSGGADGATSVTAAGGGGSGGAPKRRGRPRKVATQ